MTAQPPSKNSRREMRKALVRLRLEMHRQEIRHESSQLVNPFKRLRGMTDSVQAGLGIKHAPLWGMAGVMLMGFLTGKRTAAPRVVVPVAAGGSVSRLVRLGTSLIPLIKLALRKR